MKGKKVEKCSKKQKKFKKGAKKLKIQEIKMYIEFAITIMISITALILLLKMIVKKRDKNKNGKIETEEIDEADMQFCKELLKESIKTIAIGLNKQGGLNSQQINKMMLNEIKQSKTLIEETIKGVNQNEKN